MWFLLPLAAIGGLVAAFVFGGKAREADVATRGPKAASKVPANAKSVTGDSGETYLVAMVDMQGDVQTFDVWHARPPSGAPVWVLRYVHNRETGKRMLMGTASAADLQKKVGAEVSLSGAQKVISTAKEDFGV